MFLEDVVREARVLARPLKSVEPAEVAAGKLLDGIVDVWCDGDKTEEVSDVYDCDLDEIAIVRL